MKRRADYSLPDHRRKEDTLQEFRADPVEINDRTVNRM